MRHDKKTSYLLWLLILFGVAGAHRLYNRKFFSGTLWLFTWGLFGFGQFVDLILIPDMVDEYNLRAQMRLGLNPYGVPLNQATTQAFVVDNPNLPPPPPTREELMLKILQAAQEKGGKLSVTQAVLATGRNFEEVEKILREMVKSGYVAATNDPSTGIVVYDFVEL